MDKTLEHIKPRQNQEPMKTGTRRRKKQPIETEKAQKMLAKTSEIKKQIKWYPTPYALIDGLEKPSAPHHKDALEIVNAVDSFDLNNRTLKSVAVKKALDSVSEEAFNGRTFQSLNEQQKRIVLTIICGDDWATLLKTVAPPALNFLWKTLKNSTLGRRAQQFLTD